MTYSRLGGARGSVRELDAAGAAIGRGEVGGIGRGLCETHPLGAIASIRGGPAPPRTPSKAGQESRDPSLPRPNVPPVSVGSPPASASNPSMAAMTGERTAPEVPMPARPTSAKVVPAAPPSMPPFGTAQPASPGRVVLG